MVMNKITQAMQLLAFNMLKNTGRTKMANLKLMLIIFVIISKITGYSNFDNNVNIVNQVENVDIGNQVKYVDLSIKKVIESVDYKSADIVNRQEIIKSLLKQFKKDMLIKYFSYNEDSFLFSFEYCDGTLGGVYIKDFDSRFNAMPHN